MGKIKFRAWEDWTEIENENNMDNKLPKKMHSWRDLKKFNRSSLGNAIAGESSELTLMQFTGLKDKNGKEIYEGDILKSKWDDDDKPEIGVIEWIGSGLKVVWKKNTDYIDSYSEVEDLIEYEKWIKKGGQGRLDIYEVIGNIYENPEVLSNSSPPVRTSDKSDSVSQKDLICVKEENKK